MNIGPSQYGGAMLHSRDTASKKQRVDGRQRSAGRAARSIGTRHSAIHQRTGQQLPGARSVVAILPQRLADALRDAAVTLAVE